MTGPLAEAADLLATDKLTLTCHNLWVEATPEASIIHNPWFIDIEPAGQEP